jgi:2-polyprenyl-6-methoxyphenol hydroxylase-like FAD-dependent oxidoreductase
MKEEIVIIGGGIAGLTTALALQNIGKQPIVFESAKTIKAIGAGLGLAANAMQAFNRLNIMTEVIELGRILPLFTIYDQKGKQITKTDSKSISRKYGIDNFTIHRADLHKLLFSKIDGQHVFTNKTAIDVEQKENSVIIKFHDGSSHETNFVIVADGIHSEIRKKLCPGSLPRYAGYTCWRAIIDNPGMAYTESSETWGSAGRFGIVPLAFNKLYWFACINANQNDEKFKAFTIADLQNHFKNFHHPIPEILQKTSDEALIHNDIIDLKPINNYAFKNMVLIGDAAHATTPNMGQGACQAIEDAIILAAEINRTPDIQTAFLNFEKRRIKRTHEITKKSWNIGKIAQLENPFLVSLRNSVFRLLPSSLNEQQLKKIYAVDF